MIIEEKRVIKRKSKDISVCAPESLKGLQIVIFRKDGGSKIVSIASSNRYKPIDKSQLLGWYDTHDSELK